MEEEIKTNLPQTVSPVDALMAENDPEKAKRLMAMFNLNSAKKNAARLETIDSLIDDVLGKISERLEKRGGEFSNKDLLDYINVLYNAADRSSKSSLQADQLPTITFNQQNNVVVAESDGLSRESKQRIAAAVTAILDKVKNKNQPIIEEDVNEREEDIGTDDGE